MKLDNLRIGTRLAAGFGAVLLLLAVSAVLSYTRLVQTQQELRNAGEMSRRAALVAEWARLTEVNLTRTVAIAKGGSGIESYFAPLMVQTSARISEHQKALGINPFVEKNYKDALNMLDVTKKITTSKPNRRKGTFADDIVVTFPPKEKN